MWGYVQDLKAADDVSLHQMTQLNPEKKTEATHTKTQMLLQLAQWKAAEGEGDQTEISGCSNLQALLSVYHSMR